MITIGPLNLTSPLLLAPLAGYTDIAFRLLAADCGCSLVFSEMVSACGLVRGGQRSLELARTVEPERPVAVQLFGADPDIMGRAAALLPAEIVDIIDINMGCPVRKVTKSGAGAALMRTPALAGAIIESVVKATSLPVTVKIRSGWDGTSINAVEIARIAETAGAAAVTVHARTRSQGFTGTPDMDVIRNVISSVAVPVFWSGDIRSPEDAQKILDSTDCAGFMVGRGALGHPWVLEDIASYLSTGHCQQSPPAGREEIIPWIRRHVDLIENYLPEDKAFASLKLHLFWYIKGFPGAKRLRTRVSDTKRFSEVKAIIDSL